MMGGEMITSYTTRRRSRRSNLNNNMKLPIALLTLTVATAVLAGDSMIDFDDSADRRAFPLSAVAEGVRRQESLERQLDSELITHQHEASTKQLRPKYRRQLQQEMMCSCSPTIFNIRLDFSKDCITDTLRSNDGIKGTLCALGELPPNVIPRPPSPSPPTPGESTPAPVEAPVAPPTVPPVSTEPIETPQPTMGTTPNPTEDPFLPPRPEPPTTPNPTEDPFLPPRPAPTTPNPTEQATLEDQFLPPRPANPNNNNNPRPPPTNDGPTVTGPPATTTTFSFQPTLPWPTWSPTESPWPTYSPTIKTVAETRNGPGNSAAPTDPWPTYSPTGEIVTRSDNLNSHSAAINKKKLKKILKEGMTNQQAKELRMDMRSDESVPNVLEKYYGYTHSQIHGSSSGGGSSGSVAYQAGAPTYEPTTAFPTSSTPWPTDDETYAPTSSTPFPTNDDTGRVRRLTKKKKKKSKVDGAGGRKRGLLDGGVIGKWTSIPLNDEFFQMFPEWRSRQEEIYRLRNSGGEEGHRPYAQSELDEERRRLQSTNSDGLLIPNQLLSALFLELDTSKDMHIINQDEEYINVTFPPNDDSSPVTDYTLSFTSISAMLDPDVPLDDQLQFVPGGVILVLIASAESGEFIRNRLLWTYEMGCGMEESVTVEVGDEFGWAIFDKLEPAREEFCPNGGPGWPPTPSPIASGQTLSPTKPTPSKMPSPPTTKKPSSPSKPSASSKSSKPHKPSPPSKPSSSSSSKASKPHKPPSSGMSMPSSGDLMDHFDLDSKSGKPATTSDSDKSSTKRSGKSSSRRRRRMERIGNRHTQQQRQSVQEEEMEVFGRRISRRRESSREKGIADEEQSSEEGKESDVEFGRRPLLKRRLRKRSERYQS